MVVVARLGPEVAAVVVGRARSDRKVAVAGGIVVVGTSPLGSSPEDADDAARSRGDDVRMGDVIQPVLHPVVLIVPQGVVAGGVMRVPQRNLPEDVLPAGVVAHLPEIRLVAG